MEDTYSTQIELQNGENRSFKILDTAGEDDYQSMIDEWIKEASGFLLVYAINDKESFDVLKAKLKRIKKNNKEDIPIIIVGNKCDLESKREVSQQSANDFAKSIGTEYFEISALTDQNNNIKILFQKCAQKIQEKYNSEIKTGKCACYIF